MSQFTHCIASRPNSKGRIEAASVYAKNKLSADGLLLRNRVEQLEAEVTILKSRLKELRRAKNDVTIKRVKETQSCFLRTSDRVRQKTGSSQMETGELLPRLHAERSNDGAYGVLQRENEQLKRKIADLSHSFAESNAKNIKIEDENRRLSLKVQELVEELSIKEAEWCEKEEKFRLKMNWGEHYHEWMRQTELKVQQLQRTNFLLRKIVSNSSDSCKIEES